MAKYEIMDDNVDIRVSEDEEAWYASLTEEERISMYYCP